MVKWDDSSADPVEDIGRAKKIVENQSGLRKKPPCYATGKNEDGDIIAIRFCVFCCHCMNDCVISMLKKPYAL